MDACGYMMSLKGAHETWGLPAQWIPFTADTVVQARAFNGESY